MVVALQRAAGAGEEPSHAAKYGNGVCAEFDHARFERHLDAGLFVAGAEDLLATRSRTKNAEDWAESLETPSNLKRAFHLPSASPQAENMGANSRSRRAGAIQKTRKREKKQ